MVDARGQSNLAEPVREIRDLVQTECLPYLQDLASKAARNELGLAFKPLLAPLVGLDEEQSRQVMQHLEVELREASKPSLGLAYRDGRDGKKIIKDNTHLLISPEMLVSGDKKELQLAVGAAPQFSDEIGLNCENVSSKRYVVPDEIIGERIFSLEEIFRRFGRALFQQMQSNSHRIQLIVSNESLEPLAAEALVTINEEFQKSSSENTVIGADRRFIRLSRDAVDPSSLLEAESSWIVKISSTVHQKDTLKIGIHAEVKLSRGAYNDVSTGGLVRQASLPAQIVREAAPERARSDLMARMKVASIKSIQVGDGVVRLRDTFQSGDAAYAFKLPSDRVLEFDLEQEPARTMAMYDAVSGREIMPAFVGDGNRPNLRRFFLPGGQYLLKVGIGNAARSDFILRSRGGVGILEPEPPGQLLREYGAWSVGVQISNGQRVCYAFTTATEQSRVQRLQKPVIWFSIPENKDATVLHFLDVAQFYSERSTFSASVFSRGLQQISTIAVSKVDGRLMSVQRGSRGENILNVEGLQGFTRGTRLRLRGTDMSGKPSEVFYSLVGYRQAITSMAHNCGRPEIAESLVW